MNEVDQTLLGECLEGLFYNRSYHHWYISHTVLDEQKRHINYYDPSISLTNSTKTVNIQNIVNS